MQTYQARYRVTIGDINYGGHLGNDRALTVFQDARIQFLRALGCSEGDVGEGRGIIMVEGGVKYLREIFLHDDLAVAISVAELKAKKFTLGYVVSRGTDGEQVLSGFTAVLAFDYGQRKVAALPESFREKLEPFVRTS